MPRKTTRLLLALIALVFSILAFALSVAALTSKDWAVRDNYDPTLNTQDWTNPIYTLHRSPFIICSATANTPNGTSSKAYNLSCLTYKPFGFNRTSCELAVATQSDTALNTGDARLCQQVHYAGNFGIASAVMFGVGFLFVAILSLSTFLLPSAGHGGSTDEAGTAGEGEGGPESKDGRVHHLNRPVRGHPGNHHHRRSAATPYVNLLAITLLSVGVITALISQFYAVEGLIQSMPNNSDFASSTAGSNDNVNVAGNHGPWYQGQALSVYVTVGWGFGAGAAAIASLAWRLPQHYK